MSLHKGLHTQQQRKGRHAFSKWWNTENLLFKARKILCLFRFNSTSLSQEAAGSDFKSFSLQGKNKNKYLFCGLLSLKWERDETQIECRKKKDTAAEVKKKDMSVPLRKIYDFGYCPIWLIGFTEENRRVGFRTSQSQTESTSPRLITVQSPLQCG